MADINPNQPARSPHSIAVWGEKQEENLKLLKTAKRKLVKTRQELEDPVIRGSQQFTQPCPFQTNCWPMKLIKHLPITLVKHYCQFSET